MINSILSLFSIFGRTDSDTTPSGADAVRTAVQELENIDKKSYEAVLGEPDIRQTDGMYFNSAHVVVPINESPHDGANQLVFDVPKGKSETSVFNNFLNAFDLEFESIESLEGKTVPVYYNDGNEYVAWEELENPMEGLSEEWQEEDIDDVFSDE